MFLAPFDELVDPRLVAELAEEAEARGWDGLFVWDHIRYTPPVRAVADPWVVMSAVAARTERLRIGPMVTPLPRRRVQKLARETVSLDVLSRGRLVLGIGIGGDFAGELSDFGEETDDRRRGEMLDADLARLAELWAGEFEPVPVQQPRIPVWAAARYPSRRPVRRAAAWDGLFPIDLPGPDALRQLGDEIGEQRGSLDHFDLVVEIAPGDDPEPWAEAGATWVLTGFGSTPRLAAVRAAILAGPGT